MSRIDPPEVIAKKLQLQDLLNRNLSCIKSIQFGPGKKSKWPRFKFEEVGRASYGFFPIDNDPILSEFPQNGMFLVSPFCYDANNRIKRQVVIVRSKQDQGAVLDAHVLLMPEENQLIDDILKKISYETSSNFDTDTDNDNDTDMCSTAAAAPVNLAALQSDVIRIQKMLLEKTIGFYDHSILKLETTDGRVRFSVKAGKGQYVGIGAQATVKDEMAYAEFDSQDCLVPFLSQDRVIRSAVAKNVDPCVHELNLNKASAFGLGNKKKLPYFFRKRGAGSINKLDVTSYTVLRKGISLKDYIVDLVKAERAKNPVEPALAVDSFQFPALPVHNSKEAKILFKCAVDIVNAVRILHQQGIAQRDIKPENLLVHTDGDKISVQLTDFDLSTDCRTIGIEHRPTIHCGALMYIHNFNKARDLSYREIDIIALLKTLLMDADTTFMYQSRNLRFNCFTTIRASHHLLPVSSDPSDSSDCNVERPRALMREFSVDCACVCLFPRHFVDARPALSVLLRSVKDAVSAPYDIDTILCALLLESHGLLEQYLDVAKYLITIPAQIISQLLSEFDKNPDINPLDDEDYRKQFVSTGIRATVDRPLSTHSRCRFLPRPLSPDLCNNERLSDKKDDGYSDSEATPVELSQRVIGSFVNISM